MPTRGVILISDQQAKLKPCLRCGYSLRYSAGMRNCPECGLAVRVSLSGNTALEWSNPRWQRLMAAAFGVLMLGMLAKLLASAAMWLFNCDVTGTLARPNQDMLMFLYDLENYAGATYPLLCGLGLCLLARSERRFPDTARPVRLMALVAGALLLGAGLFSIAVWYSHGLSRSLWMRGLRPYTRQSLWMPLVIGLLACACARHLARRGGSRLLARLSNAPLWPVAGAVVVWLMGFDRLWWGFSPLLADTLFPLLMTAMLTVTIRMLLRSAREAEGNWVSDP